MSKEPADLDILTENGVLFEANRQFFHPLGLDLSISGDGLTLTPAPEESGTVYRPAELAEMGEAVTDMLGKFQTFQEKKHSARQEEYGYIEQPINGEGHEDRE
jgi:hypothetical protein